MRSRRHAFALGLGQRSDDVGEGREVDAAAGLHRLDAERHRQVRFAGAGRAEDMDDLVAVDELELGEGQDTVAVERGLEGEVEAGQRLDGGEPGHHQRRLDAPALAHGQLLGEQGIDGVQRETSPRSSWRTVRSRTSSARGILRPTRVRRMRSRTGTISCGVVMAALLRRRDGGRRPRRRRATGGRRRSPGRAGIGVASAVMVGFLATTRIFR